MKYESPFDDFNIEHYQRIDKKRMEHFMSLGINLSGKNVLELGAGIGNHTAFLLNQGVSHVICMEARSENVAIMNERFASDPRVQIIQYDLEKPFSLDERVEICYCYGLLYHLSNPDVLIRSVADSITELLMMETCVSYEASDSVNKVNEDINLYSQSFSGEGCRPGRQWVMEELRKYFPYVYITRTQPDHEQFPLDWNCYENKPRLSRSVFAASFSELPSDRFTTLIPEIQEIAF